MRSVIVWHPGATMSTSDVADGLCDGLRAHGLEVIEYRSDVQIRLHGEMLQRLARDAGGTYSTADVIYKSGKELLADASRARRLHGAEWVIVVSGMYQHPDLLVYLRDAGFRVAVLLTESPYDHEQELDAIDRRAVTGASEPVANVVFTNERTSVAALRAVQPRSYYLPHAWNAARHGAEPQAADHEVPAYDVVFVGTFFEERVEFLGAMRWDGVQLGLYGGTAEIPLMAAAQGPPAYLPEFVRRAVETSARTRLQVAARALEPHVRGGVIPNAMTAALYRRAKVGLNWHRTSKGYGTGAHITRAESVNPRVYELAAMRCFFVSDPRAELADLLPMIPTARTPGECEAVIRRALREPDWRAWVATAAHEAIQGHTWTARAQTVIELLGESGGQVRAA